MKKLIRIVSGEKMAKLYYAKININSNIYDVYDDKTTVQDIMEMVLLTYYNDRS